MKVGFRNPRGAEFARDAFPLPHFTLTSTEILAQVVVFFKLLWLAVTNRRAKIIRIVCLRKGMPERAYQVTAARHLRQLMQM